MEKLLEILEDIAPGVDFKHAKALIDNHELDSLAIISLIAEIEDAYDISIPAVEIVPANFNSIDKMMEMIKRLQEEL